MGRDGNLRDMRKRRVGETAGSRLAVRNPGMGTAQAASEMAAPLVSRTPECNVAAATSADGSVVILRAWKGNRAEDQEAKHPRRRRREWRAEARMRRCLILRQGASPLRPPAPFPSGPMFQNGGNLSRVRKPRKTGAPLTDSLRSKDSTEMRERGPFGKRGTPSPPVGRPGGVAEGTKKEPKHIA